MSTEEYNILMQKLETVEKDLEQTKHDVKKLSERTSATETAQAVIENKLDNLISVTSEIKTSLKTIENRPSTLWDKLIDGIIGALAGGIAAILLK